MVSHLRELVKEIAGEKVKIENYQANNLAEIERHLDKDGDIDAAIDEVKRIFSFHFKEADYRDLREQLNRK